MTVSGTIACGRTAARTSPFTSVQLLTELLMAFSMSTPARTPPWAPVSNRFFCLQVRAKGGLSYEHGNSCPGSYLVQPEEVTSATLTLLPRFVLQEHFSSNLLLSFYRFQRRICPGKFVGVQNVRIISYMENSFFSYLYP